MTSRAINIQPPDNGERRLGRPPSRERWAQRQVEVIDIAARLFSQRGFHATSIEDLMKATGLQKGGLYHYMDGKADLLMKIHERFIEPLLEEAKAIEKEEGPADLILRKLARALLVDIATYRDAVTVFLNEWRIIEHEKGWERVSSARAEFEHVVANVLQRGVNDGTFKIDDIRLSVLAFLGMINYSYQWFEESGRRTAEDVAGFFCDIFLEGVRA
jgi:AcrR family transcriptional regulator